MDENKRNWLQNFLSSVFSAKSFGEDKFGALGEI